MKIIIAPAKKMIINQDDFDVKNMPIFLDQTKEILAFMQSLSYEQAKSLWQVSDKLAQPNYTRLQKTNLNKPLTPAILSFSGIQYQYMAPDLFTSEALKYIQRNLRILSGFYGVLRPFDGVVPYRLEMQARLKIAGHKSLYDFWGDHIYHAIHSSNEPIINLASKEYSKVITPYLTKEDRFIDIVFVREIEGKLKTRATFAKIARGEMVRYMAENNVNTVDRLKNFDSPNYQFLEDKSSSNKLVFLHLNDSKG